MDAKMSKSKPDSAIFLHDDYDTIKRKLKKAYCPEGTVAGNPVLEILHHVLFTHFPEVTVERKYENSATFHSYQQLEKAYIKKELHPLDLKNTVAAYLEEILSDVRKHFNRYPQNMSKLMKCMENQK